MSDLVVSIRQISNYPELGQSNGSENILVQQGGLGGPYAAINSAALVSTALVNGVSMGVGVAIPGDAGPGNVLAGRLALPAGDNLFWNSYLTNTGGHNYWQSGVAGMLTFDPAVGFWFRIAASGSAGQPLSPLSSLLTISLAGAAALPFGTLTVARDPATKFEVATMGWVGNNTVARFNNRIGNVTLNSNDIYNALCLDSPIATQNYVAYAIKAAIQNLLATCNFVNTWNGRFGNVYLTLSDITCVFFQPGQQPIAPTPIITSNDNSIATTQWVVDYITTEFEGGGTSLATQSWVLANTVNSFNGRVGPVSLTTTDVTNAGGAPVNSPNFSGIPQAPTANPGQATGQIATTAFVQQAISHNTAGVSTFNTRSGDVTLINADIVAAGGLANPSPNLTGAPTAPTATAGTSTPQIANTQFVTNAISTGTVTSFNTRTGAVTLQLLDITGAGGAPLVSPNFSSVPTAPTAAPGTSTVQIATTAFVTNAVTSAGGVSSFNSRTGAVTLEANDISAAGGLSNPSVALTGTPTAPTATAGTNSQQIATTAFVDIALSGTVTSFNTRSGAVVLTGADITGAGGAVLASPAFTGVPTAPTATTGTNNTQIASTAFVNAEIAANTNTVTSFNTRTGAITLITADITAAGGAALNNPAFTGVPTGPTATAGTNTTQLATTQFVQSAIASSGVASFNTRTGAVTLVANDVSAAGGALVASPTFTGIPAAPTAAPGTNTTQLATCAFVAAAISAISIPGPSGTLPLINGTASAGSSAAWSRGDHVHPTDTTRFAVAGGTVTGNMTVTGSIIDAGGNIVVQAFGASNANLMFNNNAGTNVGNIFYDITNQTLRGTNLNGSGQWSVTPDGNFNHSGRIYSNVGYLTKAGSSGAAGSNVCNHNWTTAMQLWVDTTNLGNITVSSDYRIKRNVASLGSMWASVKALDPVSYQLRDYTPDGATAPLIVGDDEERWGFLAHELQATLISDAATGEKDAPNVIQSPNPWTVLAAVTKALQEAMARIEALEGAVAA